MSRRVTVLFIALLAFVFALVAIIPGTSAQGQTLFINEILVGNASTTLDTDYYNYSAWIEIYNAGNSAIELKNYSLAYWDDGAPDPIIWKIPVSVSLGAKKHVILWADERNKNRHANFKMDMRGDKLQLLNPSNGVVDEVLYDMRDSAKTLLPDISYGRQADGGAVWAWFDAPTPAASNNAATSYTTPNLAKGPDFSPPGGFYTGGQSITLSTDEAGGQIRYTLDGSIPTLSSPLYSAPITVNQPTAVRARVYAPGKMAGQTVTHTYLIDVAPNLPVVSLATAPAHLFDNTIGIYVKGTNGIPGSPDKTVANWNQKWERPASMEMYEVDGTRVVAQDIGIEIHGSSTRTRPQKALEIKARRTYGAKNIPYAFFDDKPINGYKRLVLRSSGNDKEILFRDLIQQYIIKDMMDIDYQAGRPAIVFLNGQYWGIYNIREKADEVYPEQNYGLDKDTDYDFFSRRKLEAGSVTAWNSFYSYVRSHDLSVQANYEYVKSQVDIEEFMNYFIVEMYSANWDWLNNNVRYWRAYDGGKWRWVLYDLDYGLARDRVNSNAFGFVYNTDDQQKAYQSLLFRKLMQNTEFRGEFAQKFASHINITFDPARVEGFIGLFQSRIAAEMPNHIVRWGTPTSMTAWDKAINDTVRYFYGSRQAPMRNQINSRIGSPGTANLTVNIVGGGDVAAAGVVVPGSGYTGPYFKNIPMNLEAVPRAGWAFVKWQETNSTDPKITVTLSGNLTRTAVFEEVPLPQIVINEIHYHPAVDEPLYEFIEFYNAGTRAVDLSAFAITSGVGYTFPSGASIAPGEYLVVAQTAATYAGNGYQVFQWASGKLKNSSDTVTLSDNHGNVVASVTYSDSAPWPTAPDGDGPSLSLLDPSADPSLPASWFASVADGGSPGQANPTAPPVPGQITVAVTGAAGNWDFTGDLGAFSLAGGNQQTFTNLNPGSYTVTETAVGGYATTVSCTNGASGTNSVTVDLASAGDVTCTFTNTEIQPATLTVAVTGAAGDWDFTGGLGAFSLAGGNQQTFTGLNPGNYTVTETAVSGYATTVSCTNGASGTNSVTVDLASAGDVTCTFTNTEIQPATLTIVMQVVGAAPGAPWQFTGGLGAFTLPAAGGQQAFPSLMPGSYTVTETAVGGYATTVSCTNGASGTNGVTVNLAEADDVTCTFTNTEVVAPACGTPPFGNVVDNFGFENGAAGWSFYTNGAGPFTVTSAGTPYCDNYGRVSITKTGNNIQLFQTGIPLEPNTRYALRVTGRSSDGRDAFLYVHRHTTPNTNYGVSNVKLDLTSSWQTFELEFTTTGFTAPTTDTRLRLWLTPGAAGMVYDFDEVVLLKVDDLAPPVCYPLALSHSGNGADPVASPVNSAGCSAGQYVAGQSISLTAAPDAGWRVKNWGGTTNNSSTANSNTVTMPAAAHAASVTYEETPPPVCYPLALSHSGNGADPVANPANSAGCPVGQYVAGQSISLTAAPDAGWRVKNWGGTTNNSSTANSNTATMPAAAHAASVAYEEIPANTCGTPPPGNVIANFGFENGAAGWSFYTNGAGPFTVTSAGTPYCDNYGRVSITKTGNNIQLFQTGFPLEPNTRYVLRVTGRSSDGRDAFLYVHRHTTPNTNYGVSNVKLDLTSSWQTFELEFTTTGFAAPTTDTRLRLWLTSGAAGTVYDFDEVILMKK